MLRSNNKVRITGVTIICLLLLLAGIAIILKDKSGLQIYDKIDAEVLKSIFLHGKTVVYVTIKPDKMGYLPPPLKAWRFGDIIVLKYCADYDLLKKISKYIIYACKPKENFYVVDPFKILIEKQLMDDLKIAKSYKGDIKLKYHKASSRWTGKGVVVAIVDSGVDYLHPDLKDSIYALVSMVVRNEQGSPIIWINNVNGTLEQAWEFEQEVYNETHVYMWMDTVGHGTHVAGIIAGTGNASNGEIRGLAPDSKIISIKAFINVTTSVDVILDALEWIEKYAKVFNITVVNLSLGIAVPSNGLDPVSLACDELVEQGLIVFASAGNMYVIPFTITSPGSARKVITIGAINPYTDKIPTFTSLGVTVDGRIKPDFVCAGVWVLSTKPITIKSLFEKARPDIVYNKYYMYLSGTSMSCAVATGLACEYIQWYVYVFHKKPSSTVICELFKRHARRINPLFKDFISGWGVPLGL